MSKKSDSEAMYDLTDVLDFEALSAVRPGSSILVSGPAMTGKDELAMEILADGSDNGEGAIVVTTGEHAEDVITDYRDRVPGLDESLLGVVDCRGESGRDSEYTPAGSFVYHLSSPGEITGMGIGITKCMENLANNGADSGRFALDSLSTILTYTDKKTVFKLCHILSSRFDTAGYLGVLTIDSAAHDEQTLQVIKQAFDGMIEIRENDGTREARVLGLAGKPTDWQEF